MSRPPSSAVSLRRAGFLFGSALLILLSLPRALRAQSDDAYLASAAPQGKAASEGNATSQGATASQATPPAPGTPASPDNTPSSATVPATPPEAASPAFVEPYTSVSGLQQGVQGLQTPSLAPGAFGENPAGIPYSSVLTPTGADYNNVTALYGDPLHSGYGDQAKVGGAEGSFSIQSGNASLVPPFIRPGTEPENADIKAGPFFIKFRSLDGLVLYSDNFTLSQNDRRSELLVLLGLNLTVIAQISDNLQFAISGSIDYLPLQHQIGIETGAYGDLGLLLFAAPLFGAQMAYDTVIAGWPVRFGDDFRVGTGTYSDGTENNFDLFNGDYLQREGDGRYTFRPGRTDLRDSGDNVRSENESVVYFSNTISALTDRLLPDDARLTLRIEHQDLWYNQDTRGLPSGRDDFLASLVSERENLRFKPYVNYEATYVEDISGITQIGHAGIFGPIDDQLFLRAEAGYYTQQSHQNFLYLLALNHEAGPYTTEVLSVDRGLTSFDQEQRTSEYYRLSQILGPTLVGNLFLAHSSYEELINDGISSRNEYLGGAELAWYLGPKTSLQLAGIYEHQNYASGTKADTITGRLILTRTVTDTLTFQILYEYQRVSANLPGDSYFENIVYLQMIKVL